MQLKILWKLKKFTYLFIKFINLLVNCKNQRKMWIKLILRNVLDSKFVYFIKLIFLLIMEKFIKIKKKNYLFKF